MYVRSIGFVLRVFDSAGVRRVGHGGDMSHYSIVFEGRIGPDERPEEVKRRLADLYRVDLNQIERLFSGRPVIIKKNLDRQSACSKKEAFEQTGARCRIVAASTEPPSKIDTKPAAASRMDPLFQPRRPARNRRRFRIYHPLYMSFYSKDLYRDAAENWKGFAYTYLLFVLTVATLVATFQIQQKVSRFVDRSAGALVRQIPQVTVTNGELSADCEQPYVIVDPETGKELAILDTTGQVTDLQDSDAVMLLTRDQLIYRKSDRETRILDLSGIEDMQIDHRTVHGWIEVIRQWLAVAIAPFLLIGSIFYRLVQVLFYALVGWIMTKILQVRLSFQALVSIAVVSITPAMILILLADLMSITLPQAKFISFLITTGFLLFAVRANAGERALDLQPA